MNCSAPCACGTGIPSCGDSWQLAREFVWGDSNRFPEPIAMVDYTGGTGVPAGEPCSTGNPPTGCVYHYLHDVLGSVVGLTNSSGALVERYTYDPYGKTLIESRDPLTGDFAVKNASVFGNPFMWTLDARFRQKEPGYSTERSIS
jgi:hypothetical protein